MKSQLIAAVSGALFASVSSAQATIDSGNGFGTYYYDIEQIQACGADFSLQNQGNVECSFTKALPLTEINSNKVVAMNHTLLKDNLAKYCGKRVVVTVNGKKSDMDLFIGDGCERCGTGAVDGPWNPVGAPGLDFSYSVLSELSPDACAAGHIDMSWEIVDDTLYEFDTT